MKTINLNKPHKFQRIFAYLLLSFRFAFEEAFDLRVAKNPRFLVAPKSLIFSHTSHQFLH